MIIEVLNKFYSLKVGTMPVRCELFSLIALINSFMLDVFSSITGHGIDTCSVPL